MRKAPNPKIFLGLAFGTFVAGAGVNYMAYSGLTETQGKVSELRNQVRPTSEVQGDLDRSTKDLTAMSAQLTHLEAGLPDFAYIPTMLADLEQAGKANGIEVVGVRPAAPPTVNPKVGEKQERKPYSEIVIEVKGRGRYAAAMKFVDALQKFPKIVAVRTMSMSPKNDPAAKDPQALDITIDLKAFVFQQPKTAPAAAPAAKTAALEVRHEG